MAHILSSCKTALAQGRYRWRHDKVLTVLACSLEEARKRKRQRGTRPGSTIAFVREGERREVGNILEKAKTWELRVDLGRKLQFPKVVQINLRPDAVLWAEAEKKLVLVELTVPWEERCDEAYERKKNKYQELIDECRSKGWQAWLFPVEVGCRGFPAQSVWKLFTAIGVKGKERKVAVRKLGEAAERSSCWLWSRREESCWKPGGEDVHWYKYRIQHGVFRIARGIGPTAGRNARRPEGDPTRGRAEGDAEYTVLTYHDSAKSKRELKKLGEELGVTVVKGTSRARKMGRMRNWGNTLLSTYTWTTLRRPSTSNNADIKARAKKAVVVEGATSGFVSVEYGVPQGSVLSPSLFLLYINDLPKDLSSIARLFADDTLAHNTVKSIDDHQPGWTELFVEWLRRLDRNMGRQKRKILPFADNGPSHPDIRLKNVELKFFPPNTKSKLQPMSQGIIQTVSS
ncbi:hypothetical protein Bbelb_018210 [Branchiostoma belcheri]|nr:hypothetical protein Bbelb_018210 [Branchiostoma belcheri]